MILIAIYLVYLLIMLFCAGGVAKRLLLALAGRTASLTTPGDFEEDLSSRLLLGLIFLITLVTIVSLFHPIDLAVHLLLSALMFALGGRELWTFFGTVAFGRLGFRKWFLGLAASAILGGLILVAANRTTYYDTGIYHAQTVRWVKEFGVVPGLANLQARLGYNSAVHVFASFVDQGPFDGRSFHVVNVLIGIIFLLVFLKGFQRLLNGSTSFGTFLRCLGILVLLHDCREHLPSLSTDWPTRLFVYFAAILAVERIERHFATNGRTAGEPLLETGFAAAVCVFALTIKLPAVPILLLLPLWWIFGADKWRAAILLVVPAAFVAAPFVARNVVQTGYLLYPFARLDLFGFDWKVPRADVQSMEYTVKYYAINSDDQNWHLTDQMALSEQIQAWLKYHGYYGVALLPWLFLGGAALLIVNAIRRARRSPEFFWYCAVCCIPLAGILLCIAKAPDPRYADGWCMLFGLLPAAWLAHVLSDRQVDWTTERWKFAGCLLFAGCMSWGLWQSGASWIYRILPLVWVALALYGPAAWIPNCWRSGGAILLIGCTLWVVGRAQPKYRLLDEGLTLMWKLYDFPEDKLVEKRTEHGFVVRVGFDRNVAWNAELPTTRSEEFNPWLQMRGNKLEDGFRVTRAGLGWGHFDPEQKFATPRKEIKK